MKQEILISTAIIGASAVAGIAIAGGPSGIFPPDEPELVIDDFDVDPEAADVLFEDDEPAADTPPATVADEPDMTDEPGEAAEDDADEPTEDASATTAPVPATSTANVATSTTTTSTTTTTLVLVDRDELAVAVGNGSGIGGSATATAEGLESLGYDSVRPANTALTDFTNVYAAEGFTAEAERLASDVGLPTSVVLPLIQAPTIDAEGAYDLILILGNPRSRPTTTTTVG